MHAKSKDVKDLLTDDEFTALNTFLVIVKDGNRRYQAKARPKKRFGRFRWECPFCGIGNLHLRIGCKRCHAKVDSIARPVAVEAR